MLKELSILLIKIKLLKIQFSLNENSCDSQLEKKIKIELLLVMLALQCNTCPILRPINASLVKCKKIKIRLKCFVENAN
jgi:hypothetical protein